MRFALKVLACLLRNWFYLKADNEFKNCNDCIAYVLLMLTGHISTFVTASQIKILMTLITLYLPLVKFT